MSNKGSDHTIDMQENAERLVVAISPKGDFVVELVGFVSVSELSKFKFNVKKLNKNDLKYSKSLSYRKLSPIHTTEFTKDQLKFIEPKKKLDWSIAVSDILKSETKSRLLAISCISHHDMTPKGEEQPKGEEHNVTPKGEEHNMTPKSEDRDMTPKSENYEPGFVVVYFINMDYSKIKMTFLFNVNDYGGIVKLFSNNDNIKKIDDSNNDDIKKIDDSNNDNIKKLDDSNNDNIKNIDGCILVILNVTGIYKYHFGNFDKPPDKTQMILHLVDTTQDSAPYMELYDLKTDQLVYSFQRENLNITNYIADIPSDFAISNNNKFLAYKSGKRIKLYLIECGLEIAFIMLEEDKPSFDDYFMLFFNNDEKLL
ncbi:22893_t:CDS:2, partial [Racocetra persica]